MPNNLWRAGNWPSVGGGQSFPKYATNADITLGGASATQPGDQPEDVSSGSTGMTTGDSGLRGKRAAMVVFSPYPFDSRPRRAADALLTEGMSVDYLCLGDENAPKREVLNGINVSRLPVTHRRAGKIAYVYQYSAFIFLTTLILGFRSLRRRYDLVYVHNMPDVLVLCALVPKLFGAKVILDQHDPMPELMKTIFNLNEDSLGVRLLATLEKWSIWFVDQVITVNIACKRIFSNRSCPPEKISVVMNSPDEGIFTFQARPPSSSSARATDKPFTIMYHGSIVERNGLDVGLEALAEVVKTIPNVHLKIFGTKTAFLDRVMAEVHSKGLDEYVSYYGSKNIEYLVPEIESCDLGIVPNQRNAFTDINTPVRLFEYLCVGKPVIAPRTPGIQDYFNPDSLLFFEPGDATELARQIEYVYSHPRETDEVVERGQQVYLANRWTTQRQTMVDVVSGLIGTKKERV